MPIWNIAAVADVPNCTLVHWSVMALPNGDRHLVGYAVEDCEGRASSRIEEFDPARLRAITSSGRAYELRGRPGWNADAEYTWNRWRRINGAAEWCDVTATVWQAHEAACAAKPTGAMP